jgi:transposase InsO family protein
MDRWAYTNGVVLDFSRRGKPTDNAAIESFNGRFRQECLNVHWFQSMEDAATKIEQWRQDYNENHPHRALKGLSPDEYARARDDRVRRLTLVVVRKTRRRTQTALAF